MKRNFLLTFATLAGAMLLAFGCEGPDKGGGGGGTDEPYVPPVEEIAVTGVTLDVTETTIAIGREQKLVATVAPENATNKGLTWVSSRENVATVDDEGTVLAIERGTSIITVLTDDGHKIDICTVTVTHITTHVESVTLDVTETVLDTGGTIKLNATVLPADATEKGLIWYSDNPYIVTVDDEGLVTAVPGAVGQVTVSATSIDGNISAYCFITVREPSPFGTVSFLSSKTWVAGDLIWSDVVTGSACAKATFDGGGAGIYKVDCMRHPHDASYGDMFSWLATVLNAGEICPEGWRMPTVDDFMALDMELNGTNTNRNGDPASIANFTDPEKWGAKWGGHLIGPAATGMGTEPVISGLNEYSRYWSNTETANGSGGMHLSLVKSTNSVSPGYGSFKYYGMPVRCVKDR